jgi:transposase
LALKKVTKVVEPARHQGQRGPVGKARVVTLLPHATSGSIAAKTQIPKSTIRRDLSALGLVARKRPRAPRFFVGDKEKRVVFAKKYLKEIRRGGLFLFSDEKYCNSNDNSSSWAWVRKGESPEPRRTEQWASKVHVWGLIGIGVKQLIILPRDARINSDLYVKKCIRPCLPLIRRPNHFFMQDGAPAHKSTETLKVLQRLHVNVLPDWPPRSPDLNPIETLWAILAREIAKRGATSVRELEAVTKEEWDNIPQSSVDELVLGFEKRLRAVIGTGGETIGKV